MTKKKNTSRVLLIIACVLSFVTLGASAIGAILLGFNVGGISDVLREMLLDAGYAATEVDSEITMMMISFVLEVFIELSFALFYLKAIKFRANSLSFARRLMSKSIWHFVLGSFLPSLFAMLSAWSMGKQKQPAQVASVEEAFKESEKKEDKVPDYKLTAMTEAIERLKELKEKGAISEEEYYANLNRILEG